MKLVRITQFLIGDENMASVQYMKRLQIVTMINDCLESRSVVAIVAKLEC